MLFLQFLNAVQQFKIMEAKIWSASSETLAHFLLKAHVNRLFENLPASLPA